jgi:hypothetical protein
VTKSEASKPLAGKIERCDRVRLLVRLSQANGASADREDCNSRERKSADLAQWSRIAVLVSAQWLRDVLVLASWVVRRG